MKRDVNFYVGRANVKFEAGFTTKSAQKDSLSDLGIAYSLLAGNIRSLCLVPPNEARTDEQDNVYWSIPFNLHQWRAKHTALVLGVFPEAVSITVQIEELVELRNTIKSAEIVRVERIANEKG